MSSLRSTSVSIMRPPKPPSWRDFVDQGPKGPPQAVSSDFPDPTGRNFGTRSPISEIGESSKGPSSLPGTKPSKLSRRPRAKIHRTRSEHVIQSEELPTRAISSLDKFPRKQQQPQPLEYDGRQYVEENNRRCQTWLASIEACEPLDEVSYEDENQDSDTDFDVGQTLGTSSGRERLGIRPSVQMQSIPISQTNDDVDVEVPEESFAWISDSIHGQGLCGEERGSDPSISVSSEDVTRHTGRRRPVTRSFSLQNEACTTPGYVDVSGAKFIPTTVEPDKDDSEDSDQKKCNKLCCDFYKTFNSARRKSVQSEVQDMK